MTVVPELTRQTLEARGFRGFLPFGELKDSEVPAEAGVYVVLRPDRHSPAFLPSSPAGRFKERDPSVSVEELTAAWVDGAVVVYIGKAASGKDGQRGLRQRLDEYLRHGAGKKVGHWGGRYIWQLENSPELLVAWMPTPGQDPGAVEDMLIAEFEQIHGALPFANRKRGSSSVAFVDSPEHQD